MDNVEENDIVISADILLAERLLVKGAFVLNERGKKFTLDNIEYSIRIRNLN